MTSELHVILGTGPVGCWTAKALCAEGRAVRAVNRSGQRPELMPAEVIIVKADLSDPVQARKAATGATVVYQALNPPYPLWEGLFPALQAGALEAARANGARYISRPTHRPRPRGKWLKRRAVFWAQSRSSA
jgi:uncharacterized protein YbjT (DUF2867 family)